MEPPQRTIQGDLLLNFQPGIRYCIAIASSRAPQAVLQVQAVGALHFVHVQLHTQTRLLGQVNETILDLERLLGQALTVLPDPVRVDGRDAPRRGSAHMGEHRQRDIEVVVGMRAPGQSKGLAHLRHTH